MALFTALAGIIANVLIGAGVNATIAGAIGSLVVGATLSVVSGLFTRPPSFATQNRQYQSVLNQSAGDRSRGYGKAQLGGIRAFFDSKDGVLHQVVMHHSGEIAEFERVLIGDIAVNYIQDSGWVITDPFGTAEDFTGSLARVQFRFGTDHQAAFNGLNEAFGAWTDEHRLKGIACTYVRFYAPDEEDFIKVFPEGAQTAIRVEAKLSIVEDPRTGTFAWSDNPSACIMDYLSHPDGYPGTDRSDLYTPDFAAFADLCDDKVQKRNGDWEARYRLWGVYSLQEDPKETLRRMLATCDGELYERADGLIGIRGGKWTAPTITLTGRDILSFDLEQGSDRFATFNELKIVYTEQKQDFQPTETKRWRNKADQARRGPIVEDFVVDMVPSSSQAQRLAKIYERKQNPDWKGTIRTNLVGLRLRDQRMVRLVIPELEIDGPFLIDSHGINGDLTGCELSVLSLDGSAYRTDLDDIGDDQPDIEPTTPPLTIETPVVDTITFDTRGGARVAIATVVEPVRQRMTLIAQSRLGTGAWEAMSVSDGNRRAVSGAVPSGVQVGVRMRWKTARGATSDWSTVKTTTS